MLVLHDKFWPGSLNAIMFIGSLCGAGSFTKTYRLNHLFLGLSSIPLRGTLVICSSCFVMLSLVEENCTIFKLGFSFLFIIVVLVMNSGASS